ncbi:MAG TPA: glycosyl transferase [Casimicrobiaceae bacterium]|nr:glycosyl transferase [Casimicrobiaceae bacterium]
MGGLVLWSGFAPVAAWWTGLPGGVFTWIGWCLLLVVSLADDYRHLPAALRLLVHAVAALIAAWGVAHAAQAPDAIGLGLIALAIAWSANAFNFMDGSDGLAAIMTITGFTAYAMAAGTHDHGATYAALAAATVPFALVNAPPARMFLGDGGAVPIGYLAATCGIAGALDGVWPVWFPLLVFLPFWADATVTLARRLWRRERVWQAHREHYYQRLHQLGGGHRGTLAAYAALMIGTATTALVLLAFAAQWGGPAVLAWCAVLAVIYSRIDYHWDRRERI